MNTAVLAPSSRGLGHRPFKARTPVRIRLGLPKIKTTFWVVFIFVKADPTGYARAPILVRMHHMKTQFSWATPTGTQGEYADEQLANLQKRIWLIEFLRLGLIIGWQGAMLGLPKIQTTQMGGFFICPTLCGALIFTTFLLVHFCIFLHT